MFEKKNTTYSTVHSLHCIISNKTTLVSTQRGTLLQFFDRHSTDRHESNCLTVKCNVILQITISLIEFVPPMKFWSKQLDFGASRLVAGNFFFKSLIIRLDFRDF